LACTLPDGLTNMDVSLGEAGTSTCPTRRLLHEETAMTPLLRNLSCVSIAASILIAAERSFGEEQEAGPKAIFVLIGQSNMAGRAALQPDDGKLIPGVLLLNDRGRWEPAKNPLNRYSTDRKPISMQRIGPGYGFARRLRKAMPECTVGLIVNARGGTSIQQWAKGQPLYENTLKRVKTLSGKPLAGVIWHQGEANANDADYLDRLQQFIRDRRRDLGQPDLPFIAGQIAKDSPVNRHIADLPGRVPRTAYAESDGLKVFDGVHFDRDSQILLGERYAEAYLKLVESGKLEDG